MATEEVNKNEKILRVKASLFADLVEAVTPILNKYGLSITGEDYDYYQALLDEIKIAKDKQYSNQQAQSGFKRARNKNYPAYLEVFQ